MDAREVRFDVKAVHWFCLMQMTTKSLTFMKVSHMNRLGNIIMSMVMVMLILALHPSRLEVVIRGGLNYKPSYTIYCDVCVYLTIAFFLILQC